MLHLEQCFSRSIIILSILVVMISITISIAQSIDFKWNEWKPATCMPNHCFCERVHDGVSIRQVSNTWSNYSFVLVGIICIIDSLVVYSKNNYNLKQNSSTIQLNIKSSPQIMYLSSFYRFIFGFSVILVGFGSLFYHASMTFIGQWFDVMGMYFIVIFSILYNLFIVFLKSNNILFKYSYLLFILCFITLNSLLGYMLIVTPEYRRYVFAFCVILVILATSFRIKQGSFNGYSKLNINYFISSLLSILIAIIIWNLDLYHIICKPDSIIQGHAIWHCLCALSCYYLYQFYCSEKPIIK